MDAKTFFEVVASELACDRGRAEALTMVVFHELRDRLTTKESNDLAAQLAQSLQGLWREGERPGRAPDKVHVAEFIGRVRRRAVLPDDREAERGVRAVFRALRIALGSASGLEGEAWDVCSVLPRDMKRLWLDLSGPTRE